VCEKNKIGEYLAELSLQQEGGCLMRFVRLANAGNALLKDIHRVPQKRPPFIFLNNSVKN